MQRVLTRLTNNRFRLKWIHKKHRKNNAELYRCLDGILQRFHDAGGLINNAQHYKLYELKRLLDKFRPNSLIEYGTGSTTPIMVDYARRTGALLTCVDEDEQWLANSKTIAGVKDGEEKIQFVCAERVINKQTRPVEISYDYRHEAPVDFVLIDGPSLIFDGASCTAAVNSDILSLFEISPPSTILVDVRKATVDMISQRLGRAYQKTVSDLLTRTLHDNYNYFTVFRLRQEERGSA